jgi:O-methyltransferase domain/Dimerisation domain
MMKTNENSVRQQMYQNITAYWVTQLMGAAARLGVADQLELGALPVGELAARVGAHPLALYRALRACAALGVFTEQPGQAFTNNALSQTLRSNVPGSMRDLAIAQSAPGHWRPWELLTKAIKAGESTASEALGRDLWDWYRGHPEESAAFTGAMDNLAAQVAAEVTRAIDFTRVGRVVDVGGANGTLVSAVLRAFPDTRGVLLDLAHVVERTKKTLAAVGLSERCEAVAGDFFEAVPRGEVMLLKQILHDWNDEQCTVLLRNCAKSLPRGGRVLVVEMVISEDGRPCAAHLTDVNMLVLLPGRERTATEYGQLFTTAGLKLERVHPTQSSFSIIEAVKA